MKRRRLRQLRTSIAIFLVLLLTFGSILPATAVGEASENTKITESSKPQRIEFDREVALTLENEQIGTVRFELTDKAFKTQVNLTDRAASQWLVGETKLMGQLGGRPLPYLRETAIGSGLFLIEPWTSEDGKGALSIAAEVKLLSSQGDESLSLVSFMDTGDTSSGTNGGEGSQSSDNNDSNTNNDSNDKAGSEGTDDSDNDSKDSATESGSENHDNDQDDETSSSETNGSEDADKDETEEDSSKTDASQSDEDDSDDESKDTDSTENESNKDEVTESEDNEEEREEKESEEQKHEDEKDLEDTKEEQDAEKQEGSAEGEDKDQLEAELEEEKKNEEMDDEESELDKIIPEPELLEEQENQLKEATAYTTYVTVGPEEDVGVRQMGMMGSSTQYGYTGDGIDGERSSQIFTVREGTRSYHWLWGWQWTYEGPIYYVYCIDITTPLSTTEPYTRPSLASYSELTENEKRRIVNMISHGYQVYGTANNNLEELRITSGIHNLTERQAIAGTQYAIWRVTNGTQENRFSQNARDLRDYLLGLETPKDITPSFRTNPSYDVENGNLIIEFSYEGNNHDYELNSGAFGSDLESIMGSGVNEVQQEENGEISVRITQAITDLPTNFETLNVRVKGVHYTSQGFVFEPVNRNWSGKYRTQPLIDSNINYPSVNESISIGDLEYRIEVEKHWSEDGESYSTEIESFDGRSFRFGLFDGEGEKINKDGSHWTITIGEEAGDSENPAVFEPVFPGDYVVKEWIPAGADYDMRDSFTDNGGLWVEVENVKFDEQGTGKVEAKNHQLFANLLVRKEFAPQYADEFGSRPVDSPGLRSMGLMEVDEGEPEGFSFQLLDADDNPVVVDGDHTFILGDHNNHRMTFENLPLGHYRAIEQEDMPDNYRWISNGEVTLTRSHVGASNPPEAIITNQELYELEVEKEWVGTWLTIEDAGPFHFRVVRQITGSEESSRIVEKWLDPREESFITFDGLLPGTYHIYEEVPEGKPYGFSSSHWDEETEGGRIDHIQDGDWILVGTVRLHDGQKPMGPAVAVVPASEYSTPKLIVTNEEQRDISLEILKTVTGEGKPIEEERPETPFMVEVTVDNEIEPPENGIVAPPVAFMMPPLPTLEGDYEVRDGDVARTIKPISGSSEPPESYGLQEIIPDELQGNYRLTGYLVTYDLLNEEESIRVEYPAEGEAFDPDTMIELLMVMDGKPVEKITVEVFNEFFIPTLEVTKEYIGDNEEQEEVEIVLYRVSEEFENEIAREITEELKVVFDVEMGETYRIEEVVPDGYTETYPDGDTLTLEDSSSALRVLNTKIPIIEVSKLYTDDNEEEVEVNLYRVSESDVPEEVEETLISTDTTMGLSLVFQVEVGETYRIEEVVPTGYTATYPEGDLVSVTEETLVFTRIIVNTPIPAGGGGGGGGGGGTITPEIIDPEEIETDDPGEVIVDDDPTPLGDPDEIILDEEPTPLGVPEEPEEVILLDEEIPLGVPVLPQTGENHPLRFYLTGLFLLAMGYVTKKRVFS